MKKWGKIGVRVVGASSLFWALGLAIFLLSGGGCSHPLNKYVRGESPPEVAFFHRIWAKDLDPSHQKTGNLPILTFGPAIHKGMVFQGSLSGDFYAFDLEKGYVLWRVQAREAISSSASVWDEWVLFGDFSGRIYAHNIFTGKLSYSFDVGAPVEGKVVFWGQRAFVHTQNHSVISFDAATGKILWSYKRSIPYGTTLQGVSNPLIWEGRLVVGFADGFLVALSAEDGQIVWERRVSSGMKFVDVDMDPKMDGKGRLYVGAHEGHFIQLDPGTGRIVQRFDFFANTPPFFIKDKIFVGTVKGELKVLGRDEGGVLKSVILTDHAPVTGVYFWKGFIVAVDTAGKLYQIHPQKLVVKDHIHLGHDFSAVYGDLAIWEQFLAVLSSRSRLYVFK